MGHATAEFIDITYRDKGTPAADYVTWTCPLGCGFTVGYLVGSAHKAVVETTNHLIHGGVVHRRAVASSAQGVTDGG